MAETKEEIQDIVRNYIKEKLDIRVEESYYANDGMYFNIQLRLGGEEISSCLIRISK